MKNEQHTAQSLQKDIRRLIKILAFRFTEFRVISLRMDEFQKCGDMEERMNEMTVEELAKKLESVVSLLRNRFSEFKDFSLSTGE
jgi:hypothetical protein